MKKTTYELLQWGLRLEKEVRDFEEEGNFDIYQSQDLKLKAAKTLEISNQQLKERLMKPEQ